DGLAALPGTIDQQRQLLLHPFLADELLECLRSQRDIELRVVGQGGCLDEPITFHHRPTRCNASFSSSSTGRSSTSRPLSAPLASWGVSPSARSASRTSAS